MSASMPQTDMPRAQMPGIDWPGLMRAGIGGLRLNPRDFWALTPAELRLMLDLGDGIRPMARQRLDDLMRAFPDRAKQNDGDPQP